MNEWSSDLQDIRNVSFYNATGVDVPPFAALELTSFYIGDENSDGYFNAVKPTASNITTAIAFNGRVTVRSGQYGTASMDLPNWAAVDPGNDGSGSGIGSGAGSGSGIAYPVVGEEWGVLAGSFYLQPDKFGFRVLAFNNDVDNNHYNPRVLVVKLDSGDTGDTGSGSGAGGSQWTVDCNNGNPIVTRVA